MQFFGIDFGTTNSAAVGYYLGNMTHFDGGRGLPYPSVVAIDKLTGEVSAKGREAREHHEKLAEGNIVITSVKSFLGTDKVWNVGPRTWTPIEVASEIFKGLAGLVLEREGSDLNNAMVSIPVGFSPQKRRDLRKAAEIAGIHISGFISEPTAAIFKNYDFLSSRRKVAVFDWGGGTLDLAVVELSGGVVTELYTKGVEIGGDDLDEHIARWLHQQVLRTSHEKEIPFDEMQNVHKDQLLVKAEELKRSLSEVDEEKVLLYDYGPFGDKLIKVTREDIEELLSPEIIEVVAELDAAIRNAKMSPKDIGCILMIGGSSKLLGLYEKILESFDTDILPPQDDADWHMAQGSAILASASGDEILSCNLGLQLSDGSFFPVLKGGTTALGVECQMRFGLVEDTQSAMFIFYEGSSSLPDAIDRNHVRKVGYLSAPSFGFTNEPIVLKASVDENLLFTATAVSAKMGQARESTWEYGGLKFKYKLPR